jgi:hypothetical protein
MQSAGIRSGNEDDAELYFLQQHYGLPTRLLDWSTIPLIALYFALGNADDDRCDGKLYIMKNMSEVVSSRNKEFQDFLTWLNWRGPQARIPKHIIAVRPNHFDRRVALQRACFTVHPSEHRTFEENDTRFELDFVKIDQGCKPKMRKDLALLGIDDFTVYGDLDHLARTLKDRYILRS